MDGSCFLLPDDSGLGWTAENGVFFASAGGGENGGFPFGFGDIPCASELKQTHKGFEWEGNEAEKSAGIHPDEHVDLSVGEIEFTFAGEPQ